MNLLLPSGNPPLTAVPVLAGQTLAEGLAVLGSVQDGGERDT